MEHHDTLDNYRIFGGPILVINASLAKVGKFYHRYVDLENINNKVIFQDLIII